MPIDEILIPDLILDDRREADRIAARIHRSVNNPTEGDAQLWIEAGEALLAILAANDGPSDQPLLSELSSASPSEAHIALLREIERANTETLFRFNQLPDKNRIGFLRLLGVSLLPAVPASTTLRFTKTDDYLNIEVVIPAGVPVIDEARAVRVATVEKLVIPSGTASGTVQAVAADTGDIRLTPNSLGLALESLAGIASVTTTTALTGGADGETVEQGKIRAREEMRIGQ